MSDAAAWCHGAGNMTSKFEVSGVDTKGVTAMTDSGLIQKCARVVTAAREFISDWKGGDFTMTKLAAIDASAIQEALTELDEFIAKEPLYVCGNVAKEGDIVVWRDGSRSGREETVTRIAREPRVGNNWFVWFGVGAGDGGWLPEKFRLVRRGELNPAVAENVKSAVAEESATVRPPGGYHEPPPIGLCPRPIWRDMRLRDIQDAVRRYHLALKPVPIAWKEEYADLMMEVQWGYDTQSENAACSSPKSE